MNDVKPTRLRTLQEAVSEHLAELFGNEDRERQEAAERMRQEARNRHSIITLLCSVVASRELVNLHGENWKITRNNLPNRYTGEVEYELELGLGQGNAVMIHHLCRYDLEERPELIRYWAVRRDKEIDFDTFVAAATFARTGTK